jgi:cell wall-associated NlpC family hydrolase
MEKLGFVRITFDGNYSTLKRGDVLYYRNKSSGGHVWIFLGNHKAAEAAHGSGYGGRITKVGSSKLNINTKSVYYIFRAAK